MKRLLTILNRKQTATFCLLIAIACRTINLLYVSYAGRDKMILLLQSKNFLEGNGLGIPKYFTSQLETPVFDYTQLWPPGYPLIIAPFLKLFNYDIYWATTIFDIIIGIALIFTVRKIALQIGLPAMAVSFLILITGCFEYPFTGQSLPTDTVSILFILLAISFCLKITNSNEIKFWQLFFTGFLLFLPCFFRYAYPPISIGIPFVILVYGWFLKDKMMIRKGAWLTIITIFFIALLFILLKNFTGQAGYITKTESGYFPENIIHWYPVVPGSFIDFPFLTSQLTNITGINLSKQISILEIINLFFLTTFFVFFLYSLFVKKKFSSPTSLNLITIWAWVSAALIFLSLGWLSFTNKVQQGYESNWNYIFEARYYGLIIIFLQLIYFATVWLSSEWRKKILNKIFILSAAVLFFIEVVHSIYFQTKVALNFDQYKSIVYREQDYNYYNILIPKLEKKYPDYELLIGAPGDNYYTCAAAYFNKKGIFDGESLKTTLPKVKTKSILVVMIYDYQLIDYQKFISNPGTKKIKQIFYSNFYLLELLP